MSIIGLGAEERQLLQNIDFNRDISLDFWLYLEKYPARWHDLFSVKVDDAQNAFSLRVRKRRLQAHGTGAGGELVPVLEHELNTKQLPLETWLRVKIRRTVTEDTIHVEAGLTAGRTTFQESASLPAEALPFEFAESGRPDVSAISESEHVGLISGFRFEGAEGLYVSYEGGRVVSNAGTAIPLKHELTRVNRGTENEGVFVHSLRTLGEG